MTEQDILDLIGLFEHGTIDVAGAEQRLGAQKPARLPGRVRLAPRDPNVELAQLEVDPKGAVIGLSVGLDKPILVNLAPIAHTYGKPEEKPRLKPTDPVLLSFLFQGKGAEVQILLGVERGADPRPLKSMTVRRFFP